MSVGPSHEVVRDSSQGHPRAVAAVLRDARKPAGDPPDGKGEMSALSARAVSLPRGTSGDGSICYLKRPQGLRGKALVGMGFLVNRMLQMINHQLR